MGLVYTHEHVVLVRHAIEMLALGHGQSLCERAVVRDLRWHEPGRSLVAGEYCGCDEVALDLFARMIALSTETFRIEIDRVFADDSRAVSVYVSRARRGGRLLVSEDVAVLKIRGDKIAEGHVYHADQHDWDRFWS